MSAIFAAEYSRLIALLAELSQTDRVVSPALRQGVWRYQEVGAAELEVSLPGRTDLSPKELFLPQTECLFCYAPGAAGGCAPEAKPAAERPAILYGVRPCDARALTLLDRVFETGQFRDPSYARRRADSLIMVLACDSPGSRCFCLSTGGGPFDNAGADILLVNAGQQVAVTPVTEKGRLFAAQHAEVFAPAPEGLSRAVDELAAAAKAAMPARIEVQRVVDKLQGQPDLALWDAIQEGCVGCSACSYLCPHLPLLRHRRRDGWCQGRPDTDMGLLCLSRLCVGSFRF